MAEKRQTIFSGIQPSGDLHLGNYIGAIWEWVKLQDGEDDLTFCIVDLHAITVPQDPKVLREKILELSALYIACGIDPKRSNIFVQSENPDHSYLTWIFDCLTPMGWMERMTQYKDKALRQGERTSVGLFHYPNLMASDILLYDTDLVPVGEDQTQHIELTRDIATKFNKRYGDTFRLPRALPTRRTARIMSLASPTSKMSKSEKDPHGTINLLDTKDQIVKKVTGAVTDSGSEIRYDPVSKPAISNLLAIYSVCSGEGVEDVERQHSSSTYSAFKKDLAEAIVQTVIPIQTRYYALRKDGVVLGEILDQGATEARKKSSVKVEKVCRALGLGRV